MTAGTLEKVSGTQAIIEPGSSDRRVTVATSSSTVITRPVSGTVGDITDGSRVFVGGTWSGRRLSARKVGIEAGLPRPGSFGPRFPRHRGKLHKVRPPKGALHPPFEIGTVVNAHDGSFTVVMGRPILGLRRVQVITSSSTKVLTDAPASLSQLNLGANVVAVGRIERDGVLKASTVTEPALVRIGLPGLVKLRTSGCSASAITTAAVLASG